MIKFPRKEEEKKIRKGKGKGKRKERNEGREGKERRKRKSDSMGWYVGEEESMSKGTKVLRLPPFFEP